MIDLGQALFLLKYGHIIMEFNLNISLYYSICALQVIITFIEVHS